MARGSRWLAPATLLAAAVEVGLIAWARAATPDATRPDVLGDPGRWVQIASATARVGVDICAAVTLGALVFTLVCTDPRLTEPYGLTLSRRGFEAMRWASRWAGRWALCCLASLLLTAASDAGLSFSQVGGVGHWLRLAQLQQESGYWLIATVGTLMISVLSRLTALWRNVALVLVLGLVSCVAPLLIGHASSEKGHDYATAAIALHVPAAAIWLGLAIQLAVELRRGPGLRAGLVERYVRVSGGCWLLLGVSGLVLGLVLDPQLTWRGPYAQALGVTCLLYLGLGIVAWRWRSRRLRTLANSHDGSGSWRLLAVELGLLGLTTTTSAAMTGLFPPAFRRATSIYETLLGYDLHGPPTASRLIFDWRIEPLFAVLSITMLGWYSLLVRRAAQGRQGWPMARTSAWVGGCLTLLVATSSGLGRYEPAMFSAHMASHMLVSTVAPVLLVWGGPLTLARQTARPAPPGLPGATDWLAAVETSAAMRRLTSPVVSLGLFAGAPFLVYFGGIFDRAARFHWAHLALALGFLVVGYLFAWTVVGVDPTPRPLPSLARLGLLMAALPFSAAFSGLVISSRAVLGNRMVAGNEYSALALPWMHDLAADQRLGGVIGLVVCEFALLSCVVSLLVRWWALDEPMRASSARPDLARPELPQPQAVGDHQE